MGALIGSNSSSSVATNFFDFAIQEIKATYGDDVKINRKSLRKFGRGESLGTSETLVFSLNQNETYVSTNSIDTISSSDGGDTANITIEGMALVAGDFVFSTQTATLNGQNKVTLTTPLVRVTRAYVSSNTNVTGQVYVYEDTTISSGVPTDLSKVHITVPAGDNQSLKASTSVASTNYFVLCNIWAFVNKKTSASADIRLKVREQDGVFRTQTVGSLTETSGGIQFQFEPFAIITPNSDIEVTATCSTTGVDVSAGFMGFFADIV